MKKIKRSANDFWVLFDMLATIGCILITFFDKDQHHVTQAMVLMSLIYMKYAIKDISREDGE